MQPTRKLLRLAQRLHAAFEHRLSRREVDRLSDWHRLEAHHENAQLLRRLTEKAKSHGWQLAACTHGQRLSAMLGALSEAAQDMRDDLREQPVPIPQLKDLVAELQYLENEFNDIIIEKASIAVQTEAIVLKEIDLGRFSIRLHWPRLAAKSDADCFEIVALDPNPAANNDSVTHPHVKDQHLCAGDATVPLQMALEQGRLVDAFCLVRSVIQTYNSASAYTSLDDWSGVYCWNCGTSSDADDSYFCESCSHDVCSDCTSSCSQCGRTYCASCQTRCSECESPCCERCVTTSEHSGIACCSGCIKTCASCGANVAASEFDEAAERCLECDDEETNDETAEVASLPIPSSGESR
jgi:hypothetical protein